MKLITIFFIIINCCYSVKAQENSTVMYSFIKNLATSKTAEKIHIHFDKDAYAVGDTIYFKSYLLAGTSPSDYSKSFYVDVANDSGKIISHSVWPITYSTAFGNIYIPNGYKGNQLFVKAYTKWNLNFDSTYLFQKSIPILQHSKRVAKEITADSLQLRLFPEGGQLVNDIESTIAFAFTNQFDYPMNANGWILNNKGDTVEKIIPQHYGMGVVSFLPKTNESYKVEFINLNGKIQKTDFPLVEKSGFVLAVKPRQNKYYFEITGSNKNQSVHLIGTMHNELLIKADLNIDPGQLVIGKIPLEAMPAGVLQLTLFDEYWIPIAERLFFVDNNSLELKADLELKQINSEKRAIQSFIISLPDTIYANLSIAVTDAAIGIDSSRQSIISKMILSSDLRGYIHQPTSYFTNTTDNRFFHFELLMLTHGWRRYNWELIKKKDTSQQIYAKEKDYLNIDGKINTKAAQASNLPSTINLIYSGKNSPQLFKVLPINADGSFKDNQLFFIDSFNIQYFFNKTKKPEFLASLSIKSNLLALTDTLISIIKSNSNFDNSQMVATWNNSDSLEMFRLKLLQESTLKEVVVESVIKTRKEILENRYVSNANFKDPRELTYDFINDPRAKSSANILYYLQGKLPGFEFFGVSTQIEQVGWGKQAVRFYLNEILTGVIDLVLLPVSSIAYIKAIPAPFSGALGSANSGAILVYTKNGKDDDDPSTKSFPSISLSGYNRYKEFYSPDYSSTTNFIRDTRTTLYWNPYVEFKKDIRSISFKYYNNDITKSYRIIIEGMNAEGKLIHIEKIVK